MISQLLAEGPQTQDRAGAVEDDVDQAVGPAGDVAHATGALAAEFYRMRLPEMGRALLMRQFQGGALESLATMLAETGIDSRKLAIETIEFPLDLTLEMAEKLDLSLCLDVGHVLSGFSGDVDFFDAVALCLPRLLEVHLHDSPVPVSQEAIVYGKDHAVLGTGDLDLAHRLRVR